MRTIVSKLSDSEIVELYKVGTKCTIIAERSGIPIRRVRSILHKADINVKAGWEYLKINTQNDDYFEKIDSEDKAYFLGLLYADGNIYLKRNRVQITLQNEDRYILELFADKINYTGKLYEDRGKYTKMIICSKKMVQDLINLGCVPNKSLILKFPTFEQVPLTFIRHFIRGYFDGDGYVGIMQLKKEYRKFIDCSFTSTKFFLKGLRETLLQFSIEMYDFIPRYKNKENSAGSSQIRKKESINNLYHLMYDNVENLFLERKINKFKEVDYANK